MICFTHVYVCFYRLYLKFTMETLLATAFGRYIDVQNGEANTVLDAAIEVIKFLQEHKSIGIPEISLILCKL